MDSEVDTILAEVEQLATNPSEWHVCLTPQPDSCDQSTPLLETKRNWQPDCKLAARAVFEYLVALGSTGNESAPDDDAPTHVCICRPQPQT